MEKQEKEPQRACPDCEGLTRRHFLIALGATLAVPTLDSVARVLEAKPASPKTSAPPKKSAETLVKTLYESLSEQQKSVVAFPFHHPLRLRVDNNWAITPPTIGDFFNKDQQYLIEQIFRSLHSEEYVEKVLYHLQEDAGGLQNYHIALFGEPGTGKFEWVLTGRHCTVRCDGDSVEGTAFGGPIFYGHASQSFYEKAHHPGNVYWYQALRANEVFKALDSHQREQALVKGPIPPEVGTDTVRLRGPKEPRPGIPVKEMTRDQKELVAKVLEDLLLPFRKQDAEEAMRYIRANGGVDGLVMAFYQSGDIGNDGVWDVWRLEGPHMVWYFRGSPHVHVWVNLVAKPVLRPATL